MSDAECVRFLQWALPRLELRWQGFRRVRRQVCKRISRRLMALGLTDPSAYRSYLDEHPEEWQNLDSCCRVSISRFYRDRHVFEYLQARVLPDLARYARVRTQSKLQAWCIGCGAGEEVYTLRILWLMMLGKHFADVDFTVLGTDADVNQIDRARLACYPAR